MKNIIFSAVKPAIFSSKDIVEIDTVINDMKSQLADEVFWGEI